jgi:hypothetical protein
LLVHEAAHNDSRRLIADGPSATRVGTRRDIPAGTAPPQQLLDKRLADAKEGRDRVLRAESLIMGAENLLPQIKGVGFHAHQPKG